jgi:hypothetical protein
VQIVAAAVAGSNMEPALPLPPRIEASGIPVLLIASSRPEQRSLFERVLVRFRSAVPSATIVPIEAGHGILQEAGDDVRRIVVDWLGRVG